MKFTGVNTYNELTKRVLFLSSLMKNTNIDNGENMNSKGRSFGATNESHRLQIQKMGPICKSRKEVSVIFSQSSEGDIDFDKQFGKDKCFDGKEGVWLSSDCSSPLAFMEEYNESDSFLPKVDELLASWLSILLVNSYHHLAEKTTLSIGTETKPKKEAAPSFHKSASSEGEKPLDKFMKQDKANALQPSTVISSESALSSVVSSNVKAIEAEDEKPMNDMEDLNTNEPIFLPFEGKVDWNSEKTWSCFSMSPRKDMRSFDEQMEFNLKEEGKRRHGLNKTIKRLPSRLNRTAMSSVNISIPLKTKDEIREPKSKAIPVNKSFAENRNYLVVEDYESGKELAIEMVLGLDEFDGHEGVDLEFNNDDFSLDDSLR